MFYFIFSIRLQFSYSISGHNGPLTTQMNCFTFDVTFEFSTLVAQLRACIDGHSSCLHYIEYKKILWFIGWIRRSHYRVNDQHQMTRHPLSENMYGFNTSIETPFSVQRIAQTTERTFLCRQSRWPHRSHFVRISIRFYSNEKFRPFCGWFYFSPIARLDNVTGSIEC